MAEGFVKSGYVARPIVQTDNFTVHEMIHDTWEKMDQAVLRQLGELFTHISARRTAAIPSIGCGNHQRRRVLLTVGFLQTHDIQTSRKKSAPPVSSSVLDCGTGQPGYPFVQTQQDHPGHW